VEPGIAERSGGGNPNRPCQQDDIGAFGRHGTPEPT
jgi:hypothetical protein